MLAFYLAMLPPEDRQFAEKLFSEYQQMMFSITYHILQHRYDAEDAIGNAILSIIESKSIKKLQKLDAKDREAYIAVVARNAALKTYNMRKKNNEKSASEYYIDNDDTDVTEKEALSDLGVQEIKAAINELNENDHNILELHFLNGMSYDEIARELDITPENARQRIHRARKRLEKILSERGIRHDK